MKKLYQIFLGSVILILSGLFVGLSATESDLGIIIKNLIGTGGQTLSWGTWPTNTGSMGKFSFDTGATDKVSYPDAVLSGGQLVGYYWVDAIGWTRFDDVNIIPPGTGESVRWNWSLSGYSWNDGIGWVDMSGMTYIPDTIVFSGYAWNPSIWWINFTRTDGNWQNIESTSSGFVGKVKVIGNLGGDTYYDTTYQISENFTDVALNTAINQVRKNVALLSRNVEIWQWLSLSWSTPIILGNTIIYKNTGITPIRYYEDIVNRLTPSALDSVRSIIVIGGDIYINTWVTQSSAWPRAIIALSTDTGDRWDIYVRWNVTKIHASLVAEGSLKSAFFPPTGAPYIYNQDKESILAGLPSYQLYIYGSIVSNNTIWWSANDERLRCPINEGNCTYDTAIRYDLNYFRDFQVFDSQHRGYKDTRYDGYSLVIEQDTRVTKDPPPGLER